ncbi:MAG: hypothetical protein KGN34_15145 [Sphingomonadales bacterium]|nr:hypothetical protein [Sphingomonadales bacterium]
MRRALLLSPAFALLATAPAYAEGLTGPWHVTGSILGHAFALDCRFAALSANGSGNPGACTETGADPAGHGEGHAGKVHPLTRAVQTGSQVTWSYPASAFLMTFDMVFTGTLAGNQITGIATAAGRKGAFTARRAP